MKNRKIKNATFLETMHPKTTTERDEIFEHVDHMKKLFILQRHDRDRMIRVITELTRIRDDYREKARSIYEDQGIKDFTAGHYEAMRLIGEMNFYQETAVELQRQIDALNLMLETQKYKKKN